MDKLSEWDENFNTRNNGIYENEKMKATNISR